MKSYKGGQSEIQLLDINNLPQNLKKIINIQKKPKRNSFNNKGIYNININNFNIKY